MVKTVGDQYCEGYIYCKGQHCKSNSVVSAFKYVSSHHVLLHAFDCYVCCHLILTVLYKKKYYIYKLILLSL